MTAVHLSKRKKTSRGIGYDLKKDWQLWIMLLPAIVYIFLFCYMPIYGAQLAFRKYDFTKGIYGGEWVGFKYFSDYFNSAMFSTTLRNTFVISLCSIVFGFPAPIVLAIIINQIKNSKWRRTLQTTVYIPYFISVVVLVSMLNVLFAKSGDAQEDLYCLYRVMPTSKPTEGTSTIEDSATPVTQSFDFEAAPLVTGTTSQIGLISVRTASDTTTSSRNAWFSAVTVPSA